MKTINLKLIGLALLLSCTWLACQRNDRHPEVFDSAAAKEWYYGSFKRSAEWAARNAATDGNQLPDWRRGVYKRTAAGETVEFPLIKDKSKVAVLKSNLPATEARQLAAAAITKVLFTHHNDGRHSVRVMEYIPDAAYLARHQYDISHLTAGNIDADFSGMIVARNWAGTELARHLLENGRIKTRLRISLTETCPPGSIQVTEYARDCESHLYGDGMLTYQCGEWYPTGNEMCYADDEPIEDPCEDPEAPMCYCQLTGECGSGGGGGESPLPPVQVNISDPCLSGAVNDVIGSTYPNGGYLSNLITELFVSAFSGPESLGTLTINEEPYMIMPAETIPLGNGNYEININPDYWDGQFIDGLPVNPTREYFAATFIHEVVHAFIAQENLGADIATNGLVHHETMISSWITSMSNLLKDIYGLSDLDSKAIALQGVGDVLQNDNYTSASNWNNFIQSHYGISTSQVVDILKSYLLGTKGTPCQ